MHALLWTYGSPGDAEPMVGLAVRLRALGAEVRVCAPPDCAERPAELNMPLAPVAAAAEECDGPAATGVMTAGVRL